MAIDPSVATFTALSQMLSSYGLSGLFSLDADGNPTGWLWNQIINGVDSKEELLPALEQTKQFKQRYGIIFELRERAANGEPIVVPSPLMVRDFENQASAIMRTAGLPPWFYDSYKDIHRLMRNNISVAELEDRVATGWTMVRDADPAVRQAFSDFYGVGQGDAALAAFILDPETTQSKLSTSSRAAYTSGYGRKMGLDVDKTLAERVAQMPTSQAGIQQGLAEAARYSSVYTEGITETDDLTSQTGIEATILGSNDAQQKLEKRILERQAQSRSSQGGAAQTQQGLVGLKNA